MEIVKDVGLITCEKRVIGQRPDSSFGGVPMGYFPNEVHMEEEEIQVKVQTEEKETRETHGKEQNEGKRERTNDQITHMDDYADETKRAPTLEPCKFMCNNECVFIA